MISDFYDSSALVESVSYESTSMGGEKRTYSTRIASLPCRVSPNRATESDEYGKLTTRTIWRLYCEASTTNKTIDESDRITIDSREFEILGIVNPGLQDHHLEIDMEEVA